MERAERPCARTLPAFRQEVRISVRPIDGSSSLIDRSRGRGTQACRCKVAAPGSAVVVPGFVPTGLSVVVGSLRVASEVFADRTISVARMDSGREILLCSAPGDREHRFSISIREPAGADFGSTFGAEHGVEPLPSVPFLRLLSGSCVSRDFAVGTGPPMGNVHRYFRR